MRIALRHVLPNAINSVSVLAILDFGRAIILESSLSFLGLGIQPPDVSWGSMLADGKSEMQFAWWPDPANQQAGFYTPEDFAFLRERPEQWLEVGPQDHDLFGDGSVMLFHLPGHTPGSLGILVRTPEGNILLATDVVHVRAGLSGAP